MGKGEALAFDVFAKVEIGDGYEQMRAGVFEPGGYSAGPEFEFGGADVVFDEEDLFGVSAGDFQAAVFFSFGHWFGVSFGSRFGGGWAERLVFEDFDGDIREGLVAEVVGEVGEGGEGEAGFAVLKFDGDGGLVFDRVRDFGRA